VQRTLKLTIAYDGTGFAGWQRQATAPTVQAAIEDALLPIEGARAIVIGAGRTDRGVHAAGQVASVSLHSTIALDELLRALNATLPDEIRILSIDDAPERFNAQFAAKRKTYRYWIWSGGVLMPPLRRYVWHVSQRLDQEAMDAAARILVGSHDFAAFQAAGSDVLTTERELTVSRVAAATAGLVHPVASAAGTGDLLVYEVIGTGFLRHMVRNITGTLVDVGRGRRAVTEIRAILESRDRSRASATAPAHGLTLWRVDY
jgi:tRNA pseudouridine38-40 synthase